MHLIVIHNKFVNNTNYIKMSRVINIFSLKNFELVVSVKSIDISPDKIGNKYREIKADKPQLLRNYLFVLLVLFALSSAIYVGVSRNINRAVKRMFRFIYGATRCCSII